MFAVGDCRSGVQPVHHSIIGSTKTLLHWRHSYIYLLSLTHFHTESLKKRQLLSYLAWLASYTKLWLSVQWIPIMWSYDVARNASNHRKAADTITQTYTWKAPQRQPTTLYYSGNCEFRTAHCDVDNTVSCLYTHNHILPGCHGCNEAWSFKGIWE